MATYDAGKGHPDAPGNEGWEWPQYYREPFWPKHATQGSDGGGKPFVHERGQLIVRRAELEAIRRFLEQNDLPAPDQHDISRSLVLLTGIEDDVVALGRRLRTAGLTVQPNHVFFADPSGVDSGLGANPVTFSSVSVHGNPVTFSSAPVVANPVTFSSLAVQPNPVTFSGAGGIGPMVAVGCCADCFGTHRPPTDPSRIPRQTLALAVPEPGTVGPGDPTPLVPGEPRRIVDPAVGEGISVLVLDTGLANPRFRPAFDGTVEAIGIDDTDLPDEDENNVIDVASGHGTFIAGIIERMAPSAHIRVDRVLSTFGAGDDALIAAEIHGLIDAGRLPHVLNLSFSGYTEDDRPPMALTEALQRAAAAGTVIVASAGNSAMCRKAWPAAQPEVVSVGALGSFGPAEFTNFGPWVRACAPGVEIVSRFFVPENDDPGTLPTDGRDAPFDGWAAWSGTSFSAPIVIGALLQRYALEVAADPNRTLTDTLGWMIDDPALCRIPGLGTAVNALP